MRWIREHKLISALLAILLALVIIFCVSVARGGADSSATDVVSKGMNVVSGGLSSVADTIKKNVFGIFAYKKLEADIEELQKENNSLKRQLAEAKIEKEQLDQLEELSQQRAAAPGAARPLHYDGEREQQHNHCRHEHVV